MSGNQPEESLEELQRRAKTLTERLEQARSLWNSADEAAQNIVKPGAEAALAEAKEVFKELQRRQDALAIPPGLEENEVAARKAAYNELSGSKLPLQQAADGLAENIGAEPITPVDPGVAKLVEARKRAKEQQGDAGPETATTQAAEPPVTETTSGASPQTAQGQPPADTSQAAQGSPSAPSSSGPPNNSSAKVAPAPQPPPKGPTGLELAKAASAAPEYSDRVKPWRFKNKEEIQAIQDFGNVPVNTVRRLRAEQIGWLKEEQVKDMTAAQVNGLSRRGWLNDTRSMMFGVGRLRSLKVEHLKPEVVGQIDVSQLQRMDAGQIGNLNTSQMTADQVNGLSPKTKRSLFRRWVNPPELRALNVRDLPGTAVAGIDPKQMQRMSAKQIADLGIDDPNGTNKVQFMNAAQVNALSPMKWRNIRKRWRGKGSTQLHALEVGKLRAGVAGDIELKQLRRMKPEQLGDFRADQVAGMSATQLRGLMPYRIQHPAVKARMFARVRALNMSEVSTGVIPQLGARFVRLLTVDQVREMKGEQFSAMRGGRVLSQFGSLGKNIAVIKPEEFGKISGPAVANFRSRQIKLVTEAQTAEMQKDQLNALARRWPTLKSSLRDLQHPEQIPPEAMVGLTNKAIRCFSVEQMAKFTGPQIAALEVRHFNAMTRKQLRQLDINHIAPAQIGELKINSGRFSGHRVRHRGARQRVSPEQLKVLLNEKTTELSATQLNSLSKKQWGEMKPESIGRISPEAFARLTGKTLNKLSEEQVLSLKPDQIDAIQFGSRRGNSLAKIKWLEKASKVIDKKIANLESQLANGRITPENRAKLEAELQRLKGLKQSINSKLEQKPKSLLGQAADGARAVKRRVAMAPTDMKEVIMTRARGTILKGNDPDKITDSKGRTLTQAFTAIGDPKTQNALLDAMGFRSLQSMSERDQRALMKNLEAMQPLIEYNEKMGREPLAGITEALEKKRKAMGASRIGMDTMGKVIKDQMQVQTVEAFRNNGCSEQDARAAAKVAMEGKPKVSPADLAQESEKRAGCIAQIPALQEVPEAQRKVVANALASNVAGVDAGGNPQMQNNRSDLVAVAKAGGDQIQKVENLRNAASEFRVASDNLHEQHGLAPQQAEKAAIVMQSPEAKKAQAQENGPKAADFAHAVRVNGTGASNQNMVEFAGSAAEERRAREQQQANQESPQRRASAGLRN